MKRYIYHFIIICFFCLTLSGCRTAPTQEVSVLVESGSLSVLEGGDGLYDIQDEDIEDFDKISLVPIFMKKGVGTLWALYGATPKKGFTDRLVLTFQSATNEHFTVLKNHYIHNGGILIKERNKMFTIQYIRGEVAGTFIPADETIEVKVDFR